MNPLHAREGKSHSFSHSGNAITVSDLADRLANGSPCAPLTALCPDHIAECIGGMGALGIGLIDFLPRRSVGIHLPPYFLEIGNQFARLRIDKQVPLTRPVMPISKRAQRTIDCVHAVGNGWILRAVQERRPV